MIKIKITKEKLLPFILTAAIIIIDQITKALVVAFISERTIGATFFNDFIRIVHVTNKGVAFSMGSNFTGHLRWALFCMAPVAVIFIIVMIYLRNDEFTKLQRWAIASIVGGGVGNLIDRFLRVNGVVDFIDVKIYGLFGMDRWPVFNIADSAVVVGGAMLLLSFILTLGNKKNKEGR